VIILPAIDIKNGQCVRLYQGDFAQATVYNADPARVARRFQEAGARWLHVVDLDGALAGEPVNVALIEHIRAATSLHIELGGGLRRLAHIERMLNIGIDRVILGTAALMNRDFLHDALARWGDRIAVGLDAREGRVAIAGWRQTSRVPATTLARELIAEEHVRRFIYTDINRDGALQGPNLPALREMQQAIVASSGEAATLIASGGVRSLDDLRALAALGVEGAIVGKALYTGDVKLEEALAIFNDEL
jgi:phosphoribosylformimino-5-aminoimidazole carboxamide ribotide isomerase